MPEDNPLKFSGDKFPKTDFTEVERAEMRERHFYFDSHFLEGEKLIEKAGLKWLSAIAKGFPAFVKAASTMAILSAGYYAAKKAGLL